MVDLLAVWAVCVGVVLAGVSDLFGGITIRELPAFLVPLSLGACLLLARYGKVALFKSPYGRLVVAAIFCWYGITSLGLSEQPPILRFIAADTGTLACLFAGICLVYAGPLRFQQFVILCLLCSTTVLAIGSYVLVTGVAQSAIVARLAERGEDISQYSNVRLYLYGLFPLCSINCALAPALTWLGFHPSAEARKRTSNKIGAAAVRVPIFIGKGPALALLMSSYSVCLWFGIISQTRSVILWTTVSVLVCLIPVLRGGRAWAVAVCTVLGILWCSAFLVEYVADSFESAVNPLMNRFYLTTFLQEGRFWELEEFFNQLGSQIVVGRGVGGYFISPVLNGPYRELHFGALVFLLKGGLVSGGIFVIAPLLRTFRQLVRGMPMSAASVGAVVWSMWLVQASSSGGWHFLQMLLCGIGLGGLFHIGSTWSERLELINREHTKAVGFTVSSR